MFCGGVIDLDATSCFSKLASGSMAIPESFFGSSRFWVSGNKCQDLRVRPFLLRLSYSLFRLLAYDADLLRRMHTVVQRKFCEAVEN